MSATRENQRFFSCGAGQLLNMLDLIVDEKNSVKERILSSPGGLRVSQAPRHVIKYYSFSNR
jgi:hypothetical protein